jgi:hypothetical protein
LPDIAVIEGHGPKSNRKMALRTGKSSMVATQAAQEHERIALGSHLLIKKGPTANDDLGHGQTGNFAELGMPPAARDAPGTIHSA